MIIFKREKYTLNSVHGRIFKHQNFPKKHMINPSKWISACLKWSFTFRMSMKSNKNYFYIFLGRINIFRRRLSQIDSLNSSFYRILVCNWTRWLLWTSWTVNFKNFPSPNASTLYNPYSSTSQIFTNRVKIFYRISYCWLL